MVMPMDFHRFYEAIVRYSPLAIIALDRDGNILLWNPAAEALLGWEEEEVVGRPLTAFFPDERETEEFKRFLAAFEEDKPCSTRRARLKRKDGTAVDVDVFTSLLQEEGRSVGVVGIIADITHHKQSEDFYKTIADSSYAGVYVVQKGKFVFINRKAAALAGYTPEEMTGMESFSIVHPEDRGFARLSASLMLKGKRSAPYAFRVITKDGQVRWIMETVTSILYDGERAILGNSMDITERKRIEEALRQSEERYRTILENIDDGYYETDLEGNFILFNEAFEVILGYGKDELTGMNYRKVLDGETAPVVSKTFARVCRTGKPERGEWSVTKKDGSRGFLEVSVALIRNAAGEPTGFRGIIHDITARKEAERAITHLAYHDPLTGLPNRILFNDRLSMAIIHSQRKKLKFALLILDLDNFKQVNDTFGHSMGDRLLCSVGKRLLNLLRKSDTVARMGGDEFLILLQDIARPESAVAIARKILKEFHKPFVVEHHTLTVTTSIGIAVYPDDGEDGETLMIHADAALYRAKREGRNRCHSYLPLIDADMLKQ
ncbi:MAG TPA: PAS domain S-box protein [Syntrophales bacterium]|nr:PAS domain S-box protein [Syntrophobacterales bacterium]HRT71182.1 PAS domain S-box protein [Syntrophales bacterium]